MVSALTYFQPSSLHKNIPVRESFVTIETGWETGQEREGESGSETGEE